MGIELVLLVFALGFVGITNGSYKKLFATKLNHWWALIPVLIGHLVIEFAPVNTNQFNSVGISVLLLTYVFLFGFLFANLNLRAMWISLIGLSSNALVIALNLGMPVTNSGGYKAAESIKHQPAKSSDLLGFLGDVIPINFVSIAISIGDIIFALGIFAVFYFASRKEKDVTPMLKVPEETILDLTKMHDHGSTPILASSKGPRARGVKEKETIRASLIKQSRKQKRWKKKYGLAGLPSKEDLGFDSESMRIVDTAN